MTFDIDIDGVTRTVQVENLDKADAAGGRFQVRIGDDPPVVVECRRTDLGISLIYADSGRSVDAALTERAGELLVQLPRVSIAASVDGRRLRARKGEPAAGTGEQRLNAPMPGRIVRILVQPGDEVAARQGLVVIEAMKMENELSAARPGRVREVAVTEGTSVEAGRLLIVVE